MDPVKKVIKVKNPSMNPAKLLRILEMDLFFA